MGSRNWPRSIDGLCLQLGGGYRRIAPPPIGHTELVICHKVISFSLMEEDLSLMTSTGRELPLIGSVITARAQPESSSIKFVGFKVQRGVRQCPNLGCLQLTCFFTRVNAVESPQRDRVGREI